MTVHRSAAYGTQVDWLRNVLTAGRASLTTRGETFELTAPEIIDATEALPLLPATVGEPSKADRYRPTCGPASMTSPVQ